MENRPLTFASREDAEAYRDAVMRIIGTACREICEEFRWRLLRLVVRGPTQRLLELLHATPWLSVHDLRAEGQKN